MSAAKTAKIYKYEFKKLFYAKGTVILAAIILAGFILITLTLPDAGRKTDYLPEKLEDLQQQRDSYYNIYRHLKGEIVLDGYIADPAPGADYYYEQYQYYKFQAENYHILSYEDFKYSLYESKTENIMSAGMFRSFMFLIQVFFIFSALLPAFVFGRDFNGAGLKDYLAAPVKRKHIFSGKLLFLLTLILIVFALLMTAPLVYGCMDSDTFLMYYTGAEYIALPALAVFGFEALTGLVIGLSIAAVSLLVSTFFKHRFISPLIAIGVYIISALMYLLTYQGMTLLFDKDLLGYLPYFSMLINYRFFDAGSIICIVLTLLSAGGFTALSYLKFRKSDVKG